MQLKDVRNLLELPESMKYKTKEELWTLANSFAEQFYPIKEKVGIVVDSFEEMVGIFYLMLLDKLHQDAKSDEFIDFDDEIVSITEIDEPEETIDITVTKDSLFYANNILTKNSFGFPMALDMYVAITSPPELAERNRQLLILLKTRYGNRSDIKPQLIGIDWSKMRFYDVDKENFSVASQDTVEEVNSNSSKPNFVNKSKDSIKDIAWD